MDGRAARAPHRFSQKELNAAEQAKIAALVKKALR
jgi:hypothetical protein